ncbi:unnamed protein product [Nezara viridula]|uniref:Geminin n=1 Tax=Nezara viridula TaxID=85310 RepID=A0A9P0HP75_NEZVI|nr:unnamed protein product [Nezara viridula]
MCTVHCTVIIDSNGGKTHKQYVSRYCLFLVRCKLILSCLRVIYFLYDIFYFEMKTEKAIKNLEAENVSSEKKIVKGQRRTLRPLQKAAGDKENLVGAGLSAKQMPGKEVKEVTIVVADSKVVKRTKTIKPNSQKPVITEEDLTSEDGPSEGYWEILAERRRVALDAALKENEELHQRIALLEEENAQCKLLLDETRHLVETLTEVINEQPAADETEDAEE